MQMTARALLRWVAITTEIAAVSIIGLILAEWLSPGNPGRSYLIVGVPIIVLAILWRLFAPRHWQE